MCSQSKALFFSYHAISWVLGWLYLYIWVCTRSLFLRISPTTAVHALPGEYGDAAGQKRAITRF